MVLKRLFDLFLSLVLLVLFGWFIVVLACISYFDTGKAFFVQWRIGQHGKAFQIFKLRTLEGTFISPWGKFLRRTKLDELPQLVNILLGEMSFVGPRPDLAGYYDKLVGKEKDILRLKPGLCSPAALKYFGEETTLAQQEDPQDYNDRVIFPDKVAMNLHYLQNRSFGGDLKILWTTFLFIMGRRPSF